MNEFETALAAWLQAAQEIINKHFATDLPALQPPTLQLERGKRYVRVVKSEPGSRSAHAFIDTTNGDVLKPASWKAPAKHARGNIYKGIGTVGVYGPQYLR